MRIDWYRTFVWAGVLTFCVAFWAIVFNLAGC